MMACSRTLRAVIAFGRLACLVSGDSRPVHAGACCLAGSPGSCQTRTAQECAADSGRFLGATTQCGVDLCPFVDSLPLLPVAQPVLGVSGGSASYEIAATEVHLQ